MRVLVIGGSGRTGRLVIDNLLNKGHSVTALIRKPQALETRDGLTLVTGTPTSADNVREAVQAVKDDIPQVAIITLNATRESDSPFAKPVAPPRFMADSAANVVAAMKEVADTPKVVIMQAFGVGESWANISCLLSLLINQSNMRFQYDDHNLVAQEVRESGVTYVLARPTRLVEAGRKEVKVWENDGKGVPLMGTISRESVASWLVDAAVTDEWDNLCPVITN